MLIRALWGTTMLIAAVGADAGAVMESVVRDLTGGRPESSTTTSAQGGMMRVDRQPSGGTMIFKNDVLYSMDAKTKTYTEMDRATIKQTSEQLAPMMKQMQEQLASMPPEQRAQMEKMMGGSMPGMGKSKTRSVRKTARAGKAAGYACTYAEILEDGAVASEMCIVPTAKVSGGQEFMDAALKMGNLLKDMSSGMESIVDPNAGLYAQLGGIPVLTRNFANGTPTSETTVKVLRSQAVPAAAFEIPAGYSKRDLKPQR